jgi:hypothetical protein
MSLVINVFCNGPTLLEIAGELAQMGLGALDADHKKISALVQTLKSPKTGLFSI